jgi:adenine deaminase
VQIDRNVALSWITSNAAWTLGIEQQTGSLEPGKMADIVVWSGDPLSVYSRVSEVFIDGQPVYERGAQRATDFELGQGAEIVKPPEPAKSAEPSKPGAAEVTP